MLKISSNPFDFNETIAQPPNDIRYPKTTKTKLLKDLNKASNLMTKSDKNVKILTNQRDKHAKINKQRSRHCNSISSIDSLLQKAIPGAKIMKGQWRDHKLHGKFLIEYDNGNIFEGKYQNDLRIEGKMVYKAANCEYEGYFFGQKFSGYGKLTYYGGRTIEGEWDSVGLVGNGTITYPNGDVYYGPVDEKLYKHGAGYLFFKNGHKYIGSFKHGSITGCGSYFKDEQLIANGVWQQGKLIRETSNSAASEQFDSCDFQAENQKIKQQNQPGNLRFDLTKNALEEIIKAFSKKKPNDHTVENQMALLAQRRSVQKSSESQLSNISLFAEE